MGDTTMALMQGTVDLLILRALQAESSAHGYTVSRFVHARTDGVLALEDAALYQALHRLEARGLIESEWGRSTNGRRAKFYRLTAPGRKQLRIAASAWRAYAAAMFSVLDGSEGSR
jgi:PadR family transcriptional regulator, regulatory protein PadR